MTIQDNYAAPESELETTVKPTRDYKLYKISGLGLAAFFGTPIASGYLMRKNLNSLGHPALGKKALVYSCIAFVAFVVAMLLIEAFVTSLPNSVYGVFQVVLVVSFAKKYLEEPIKEHIEEAGEMYSNWRAFGIALLILIPVIIVAMALGFVFVSLGG